MNPQAEELNVVLKAEGRVALKLLSERGKSIFFPRKGLVAQGLEARGKAINASIGEAKEDNGSPLRLMSLANLVELDPAQIFTYAPSFGEPALRDKWQAMIREKNPSLGNTEISRPVVTNALTHGLSVAAYLFANEGDEIILPEHYWGNYRLVFSEACGAVLKTFPTFTEGGRNAEFNISGLSAQLKSPGEKKILLFNFPNNPTGYTITEQEAENIVEAIHSAAQSGKTILVITDDAYFGLVYKNGVFTESLFARFANLHENILACKLDGATKEDYAWGFRVGFITFAGKGLSKKALAVLEDKAAGRVRGSISNTSHLSQSLLLAAYQDASYKGEKERARKLLKSRFEAVAAELERHEEYKEEFEALPFNSGYFMCVKLKKGDAEAVRQRLLSRYDTGVIALGSLIRVAYSCLPQNQIAALFANLYAACREL
ncbi:MAG: aspartate aminotransferase [Spirochaeta sp. LUC14_002_19_P3]|nr:MAG: aspartate aminotransferase [Spirochaeta sp. LUC14_002_19_P3]